jgi:hypothetical protein
MGAGRARRRAREGGHWCARSLRTHLLAASWGAQRRLLQTSARAEGEAANEAGCIEKGAAEGSGRFTRDFPEAATQAARPAPPAHAPSGTAAVVLDNASCARRRPKDERNAVIGCAPRAQASAAGGAGRPKAKSKKKT